MSKDSMPKEKMVYFRTSLGGFNREDVNSYIEKLNGEFAERERTAKRKTGAQIGEIILSAKSTADEIIEAAKREADDMRRSADEQLESAAASFNARAATAAYAVKSQIKKIANDSYSALTAQTEQTAALLHALAENIGKSSAELDDRLASGKSDAEAAIGAEAAKIFGDENRIKFNF